MKKPVLFYFLLIYFIPTFAQEEIGYNTTDIAGEFRWYPAGTITALHIAMNAKIHHSVFVTFGYNKADHKSWGEHESEKGGGWGGSLGYRYYFRPFPHKFFIGARTGLWKLKIDWKEGTESGTTNTWTVQPTFEIGYTFFINDQAILTPFIANGAEINIKTEGEEVGHGFITLVGICVGFRF